MPLFALYTSSQGSIFPSENDIYSPPPSENDIFSPSRNMSFLNSHRGLFALILTYFAFILPLFSFSFLFLPFSFLLLPFSFTISPFFSYPLHIFSPKWHRLIFFPPPPPGGGYFPIYRPLLPHNHWFWSVFVICGSPGEDLNAGLDPDLGSRLRNPAHFDYGEIDNKTLSAVLRDRVVDRLLSRAKQ